MTEIPADIRQTAERLADKLLPACDWQTTVDLIAQALLTERLGERERCIAVLERLNGIAAAMHFARRLSQP